MRQWQEEPNTTVLETTWNGFPAYTIEVTKDGDHARTLFIDLGSTRVRSWRRWASQEAVWEARRADVERILGSLRFR